MTAKGAKLYGLLGKEIDLRVSESTPLSVFVHHHGKPHQHLHIVLNAQEQRKAALSKAVDIDMLEKGVKDSIATVQVRHARTHSIIMIVWNN